MALTVKPILPRFGAEVSGVDLRQPLDAATSREVIDTMDRWGICIYRDTGLDDESHIAFSRIFGHLEHAPSMKGRPRRFAHSELFDAGNLTALYIAGFFVGTVIYPTYAINVAHANDLAEPQEYVTISSAIMVLYGLGTITGPIIGGALMQQTGAGGLPWFLAANFAAYALYAGWRITRRAPDDSGKSDFQSMPIPLQGNDPARTPNTSLNEIEAHPIL